MSVVSELYKVTVVGDGSTPSIAYNRKVFASSDIKGIKYDTTTNVETALVNGSDFTVSGAGNESASVTITPSSAIPTGTNWVIYSDQGSTQTTDLQTQGPFPANTIEYMSDKLAIAAQEVDGKADRSLKLPISDSASTDIPNKTDRASKLLGFDASGNPIAYAQGTSTEADAVNYSHGATGTESRTVESKLQEAVSVKDFGATGDGSTDDSSAFQKAIDAAKVSVETILASKLISVTYAVRIPAGTYKLASGITVPSGVRLVGEGKGSTVLKYTGTSGNAVTIDKVASEELFAVEFEGLTLWDNGTGARGISGDDGANLAIRACKIHDCLIYGFGVNVYLNESFTFSIENSILQNAETYNLHVLNATNLFAKSTRFDVAGTSCVYIQDGSTGTESVAPLFLNCTFQSADQWGLHGNDVLNLSVINCFFEANNQNASANYGSIYMEDGSNTRGKYFNIIGGFFSPGSGTATQKGINIERAQYANIDTHMRGSDIGVGVTLGANVTTAHVRGDYAVTTPISSSATFLTQQINGQQLRMWGGSNTINVASFDADDAVLKIGQDGGGQIIAGESGALGSLQGVGTGTNFDIDLNPYAGLVKMGTPQIRTALTGSNYNTSSATRNRGVGSIGIDTTSGNRTVTIASNQITQAGAEWRVYKQTSEAVNQLIIATEGSETVNGASTFSTTSGDALIYVWSDGTNLRAKEL